MLTKNYCLGVNVRSNFEPIQATRNIKKTA